MRAVIQRVSEAKVEVDNRTVGQIGAGLLVLLGIEKGDQESDADYLLDRIAGLRLFSDEQGKMNLSLLDITGSMLIVSQFTLCADARKGRRPSFDTAAPPAAAEKLYLYFVEGARRLGIPVETGSFQATMAVSLVNCGPVTFVLESLVKRRQ